MSAYIDDDHLAAASALRDAARIVARANADLLTDYEIKDLAPELVVETVPRGVGEFLNRRADEIEAGGPLELTA